MEWLTLTPYLRYLFGDVQLNPIYDIAFGTCVVLCVLFILYKAAEDYVKKEDNVSATTVVIGICLFFGGLFVMLLPAIILATLAYGVFVMLIKGSVLKNTKKRDHNSKIDADMTNFPHDET